MSLAVLNSCPDTHRSALTADKLFWFESVLILVGCLEAVLHSSEVGILALEALEVGKLENRKCFKIIVIHVIGVL